MCDHIANNTQLLVVSIEYRLAPEYCFPAAAEDCQDVADWMVLNSKRKVCLTVCVLDVALC
jgi:acetyl esterase/lipase